MVLNRIVFFLSFRVRLSKEFDELQEKRFQMSEQYRTIASSQQGAGMNATNNSMNYQTGRPQRFEFARMKNQSNISSMFIF